MSEIASTEEIRQVLTAVMRGENLPHLERPATMSERLKAIDLLGKTSGLWSGTYGQGMYDPVIFVGDDDIED